MREQKPNVGEYTGESAGEVLASELIGRSVAIPEIQKLIDETNETFDNIEYNIKLISDSVVDIIVDVKTSTEIEMRLIDRDMLGSEDVSKRYAIKERLKDGKYSISRLLSSGNYVLAFQNLDEEECEIEIKTIVTPKYRLPMEWSKERVKEFIGNTTLMPNGATILLIGFNLILAYAYIRHYLMEFYFAVYLFWFISLIINPLLIVGDTYLSRQRGPFPKSNATMILSMLLSALPVLGSAVVGIYLTQRFRTKEYIQPY